MLTHALTLSLSPSEMAHTARGGNIHPQPAGTWTTEKAQDK